MFCQDGVFPTITLIPSIFKNSCR